MPNIYQGSLPIRAIDAKIVCSLKSDTSAIKFEDSWGSDFTFPQHNKEVLFLIREVTPED